MSITLSNISKSYAVASSRMYILEDVNIYIKDGECIALIGESGTGKSTISNLIAGYVSPDSGSVTVDGRNIIGPGPDRVVVSQHDTLFPWLTIFQNSCYAGMVGHYKVNRTEVMGRAIELIKDFGLWDHRNKYPNRVSGGQRRRAELIRAFSVVPRILLLDEPFSSLDEGLKTDIWNHLIRWRMECCNTSVVLITHDIEEACFLADRVLILGGKPAQIVGEEQIAYTTDRNTELRFHEEYYAAVNRVRVQYHSSRNIATGVSI